MKLPLRHRHTLGSTDFFSVNLSGKWKKLSFFILVNSYNLIQYILSWQCNMIWCTTGKRVTDISSKMLTIFVFIFLCHYLKPISTLLMETALLIHEYFFHENGDFFFIIVNITIPNTNLISDLPDNWDVPHSLVYAVTVLFIKCNIRCFLYPNINLEM